MSDIILNFRSVSQAVLNEVLASCSRQRSNVSSEMTAQGEFWMPQVSLSGWQSGVGQLYSITTPAFSLFAAEAILRAVRIEEGANQ